MRAELSGRGSVALQRRLPGSSLAPWAVWGLRGRWNVWTSSGECCDLGFPRLQADERACLLCVSARPVACRWSSANLWGRRVPLPPGPGSQQPTQPDPMSHRQLAWCQPFNAVPNARPPAWTTQVQLMIFFFNEKNLANEKLAFRVHVRRLKRTWPFFESAKFSTFPRVTNTISINLSHFPSSHLWFQNSPHGFGHVAPSRRITIPRIKNTSLTRRTSLLFWTEILL